MSDVRDVEPCAMQVWSGDTLDPHHRFDLNRPELRKVDRGNFGNPHAARYCTGGRPLGPAPERGLEIFLPDGPLFACPLDRGQIDVEFARHATNARTGMCAGKVLHCW